MVNIFCALMLRVIVICAPSSWPDTTRQRLVSGACGVKYIWRAWSTHSSHGLSLDKSGENVGAERHATKLKKQHAIAKKTIFRTGQASQGCKPLAFHSRSISAKVVGPMRVPLVKLRSTRCPCASISYVLGGASKDVCVSNNQCPGCAASARHLNVRWDIFPVLGSNDQRAK